MIFASISKCLYLVFCRSDVLSMPMPTIPALDADHHCRPCHRMPSEALRAILSQFADRCLHFLDLDRRNSHRKPQEVTATIRQLADLADTGTGISKSNGDTTRTSPLPFLRDHVMHGVPHPSQALCETVPHPFGMCHAIVPHPFREALETVPHHFLIHHAIVPHHKKEDRRLSPSPSIYSSTSGKSEST